MFPSDNHLSLGEKGKETMPSSKRGKATQYKIVDGVLVIYKTTK